MDITVLIYEVAFFLWEEGVKNTIECMEEEHFQESRYLPLYADERTFERALNGMNLAAFEWTTWGEENNHKWPHDFRQMWTQKIGCFHTCHTQN